MIEDFTEREIKKANKFLEDNAEDLEWFETEKITIEIDPVAYARNRFKPICNRQGRLIKIITYDPPKAKDFKKSVRKLVKEKIEAFEAIKGAVEINIDFYVKPPKSTPRYKLYLMETKQIVVEKIPDVDNYFKSFADGLKNLIWEDDRQVFSCNMNKFYSRKARIEFSIKFRNRRFDK